MNSKKTIILIADVKDWAFDNIAQYLKIALQNIYYIQILYCTNYANPYEFLKKLSEFPKMDFIHFFPRKYLKEVIEYLATHNINDEDIINKFLKTAIVTNVPDHLYLETKKDIVSYMDTFLFVDNYYTTSSILNKLYLKIDIYPKPWGKVIYDNVIIDDKPNFETRDKLRVTWIGNSNWGEWHFGKDYDAKGYHTVIKPALDLAQRELKIQVIVADSAQRKHSKQEVLEILAKSDILLIAANTDGTPLPLIEAMASGCAIISSNTGIVAEVLPYAQQPFIIERNPENFFLALKELNINRALLHELKLKNYEAYKDIFLNNEMFQSNWRQLIEYSIIKAQQENRIVEKKQILERIKNISIDEKDLLTKLENIILRNRKIKTFVRFLIKIKVINYFAMTLYFILRKNKTNDSFSTTLLNSSRQEALVIYPEMYPGVKHSTLALFSDQTIIPLTNMSGYFGLPSFLTKKITGKILSSGLNKIIFSGGGKASLALMEKLCAFKENHNLDIYYLYHGSPAQWAELHHLKEFDVCYDLYKQGKIKAVISLKKDLQIAFNTIGVQSYLLQNFIPITPVEKYSLNNKFTIGLWSAYVMWVKNHYPQLIALNMLKKEISTITNFHFNKFDNWIQDEMDIVIYPQNIQHSKLMKLIANTDLTLYITNTECSPMIALESIGLGVPCLVGPSSGLYDQDDYLKDILTVMRVDCPLTIHNAIRKVMDNIEEIRSRLPRFIKVYNERAETLKQKLLKIL